jgi:V/A-type H+-transporting ATPase subunit E
MDKLQELTQKLYNEGLSKGKEEGEALLAQARAQAAQIEKQAQEEAQAILEKARKEAEDYKVKMEGDVKMAATQALQATRENIEKLIVAKAVDTPVKEALSGEAFLKEIITAVAQRFSAQESADLALVLPEKLQKNLEPFVKGELAKTVGKGVEASFSKKIGGGFKIGPKDGSYFISFTDDSFRELIGEYLRPATKKILFG